MRTIYFYSIGLVLLLARVESAPVTIHAFDIYPNEYLDVFNIIYDQQVANQFLQLYRKDGVEQPNRFYADARYEFPEVEKRVRGIIVNVQQRAKHLSPRARQFLELMSKHVEVVLVGSTADISNHVTKILNEWSQLPPEDKESYREQFPDSALILDSERYQQLIQKKAN